MSKNLNPCINICRFIGIKGWCIGCGRTKEESQKWKNLKPFIQKIRDINRRCNCLYIFLSF